MSDSTAGDWLDNTYWYVPTAYLPAEYAINTDTPVVETVQDQTVWHFDSYSDGYLVGISATDIGFGWSYMLIVGSVLADGSVKLSFSPLGQSAGPNHRDHHHRRWNSEWNRKRRDLYDANVVWNRGKQCNPLGRDAADYLQQSGLELPAGLSGHQRG
jgi:hypothetical protein